MAKLFLMTAAMGGLLAVAFGAFGAHALKARLSDDMLMVYQTAVQYHFYHVLALFMVGLLVQQFPQASSFKFSGYLLMAGLVIFSGSLYILSISGIRWLGAVAPIGGITLLTAWLFIVIGVYRNLGQ